MISVKYGLNVVGQIFSRVASDGQARALGRPILGKPGDNNGTTGAHGSAGEPHVASLSVEIDEKVKHGAVVPEVEASLGFPRQCIAGDEADLASLVAQSLPHLVEHMCRDVEHGQIGESPSEQTIDQQRGTRPDVDDRRRQSESSASIIFSEVAGSRSYQLTSVVVLVA